MIAGFRAKNHPQQVRKRGADDGVDERITPDSIYLPLLAEHEFTLDVAASDSNAKCSKYFTLATDGLSHSWAGARVWCNPPYSACDAWTEKAYDEAILKGRCPRAVLLLPANRSEQRWWQRIIEPVRDRAQHCGSAGLWTPVRTQFLPGRPRFGWPPGRVVPKKGDRPPFGLVAVVMGWPPR